MSRHSSPSRNWAKIWRGNEKRREAEGAKEAIGLAKKRTRPYIIEWSTAEGSNEEAKKCWLARKHTPYVSPSNCVPTIDSRFAAFALRGFEPHQRCPSALLRRSASRSTSTEERAQDMSWYNITPHYGRATIEKQIAAKDDRRVA